MNNSTRISLALAFVAMLPQAAVANIVCEGTYEFFNGKDTINAIPGEAPENGVRAAELYNANRGAWLGHFMGKPKSEGLHEVEVSQCGRQFLLTQGSKKMLFLQSILDETLYVAQDIGTNEAELTLRVVDHRIMVGSVKGKSHGFAFNMPVAMEPRDVTVPDMKGCFDDPVPEGKEVVGDRLIVDPAMRDEVIDIVAAELGVPRAQAERYISAPRFEKKTRQSDTGVTEILPGEPNCPIELAGVKNCYVHPSDTTNTVNAFVLLDEDGRLLPVTMEGATSNRPRVYDPGVDDLCAPKATVPPADQFLQFMFMPYEDTGHNDVQAILGDARTGLYKKTHRSDGKSKGRRGREEAADEAYQAVGAPVTGLH
ncbi:hypothetical protein [Primorskyibacter flagellatus]|uniref:hypothetical protein n=1 Tax=Primorskyibacter flagellatus TaxID=1387277 RepID=UPI003A9558CE